MSVIRVKKDKNYFAASNEPFNDERLSWEARGVMGYLLSKPDDWKLMFRDLLNRGPAGEHKMRRILKELEKHEYLVREKLQDEEGKFYWVSTVYETSSIPRLSTHGLSTRGKPRDIESTEEQSNEKLNDEEEISDGAVFREYENEIGMLTPRSKDWVGDAIDEYPNRWIIKAIGEAVKNNARSWSYVNTILKRWEKEGFQSDSRKNGNKTKAKTSDLYSGWET